MHDVAVFIAEDLNLNVSRPSDEALEKYSSVAERGSGFAARFLEPAFEVSLGLHYSHAPSAAAKGRFDDEREADLRNCSAS